ncbi:MULTISPECIES: SDR family oxidoreductase [unclassified Leeuwenhoekiella]|uniref:SDR family oxidoreductase n=1 Tax=unclassified Leeuwenhoekiella TaxID=2615029 RepID=UPI000C693DC6|nr:MULTISPECIES: SDR family oxidoreductase [unclassified Leeuwenhoekiella]MBA80725.1 NAD(P)-dependent oxidoreductase [Leeuwenhoekiella sp.]|tara:strand:- start:2318 stop:3187 length:870 start_codon:yes stop_codon:yes gene_type:complete
MVHPQTKYPQPPFDTPMQQEPGIEANMNPKPDYGKGTYKPADKLKDKVAIITGGDSGIGRAVAYAFALEGAKVAISYLNEDEDARETAEAIEAEGGEVLLIPGDIQSESHCQSIIDQTLEKFGKLDIIVNNAAFQMSRPTLSAISAEEFDKTFKTNMYATFYLCKAAEKHLGSGSSVINTTSVNAYEPSDNLVAYAATKGAIKNFTSSMAQLWGDRGIRVNAVAPGPVWTPLIPATMPEEKVKNFGKGTPLKRPGQPVEMAPIYVLLASEEGSYISGATVEATGGRYTI